MKKDDKIFHLEFNRWLIEIKASPGKGLFYVHFLNEIPDLIIKKITSFNGMVSWKSLNDDMDEMAQKIGVLIEQHCTT
jgi:hypothetical protein